MTQLSKDLRSTETNEKFGGVTRGCYGTGNGIKWTKEGSACRMLIGPSAVASESGNFLAMSVGRPWDRK